METVVSGKDLFCPLLSVLCFLEENNAMDTKRLFIMICIGGVTAVMAVAMYAMFGDKMESTLPVMNTLSSEQLAGVGYTRMSVPDDSDMWEEDGNFRLIGTTVPTETSTEVTVSFPLDINAATEEELVQIKGIGSVAAEKIIAYRENVGYFYSPDDLLNVDGIGEKKLADMIDYIFIDPELVPPADSEESASEETDVVSVISETWDTETVTVSAEDAAPVVFPLELNTATAEELMYIDGIGEVLAGNIVDYAEQYGFNDVNDLLNVSGIGESKLKSISPYVYVDRERFSEVSGDISSAG